MDRLGTSTPSTRINGEAPPCVCNDPLTPRSRIVGSPPRSPLGEDTDKPETAPCQARPTSVIGRVSKVFSVSTVDTAPVIFDRFCVPYPTTTTSSTAVASDCISTLREEELTVSSVVVYPTLLNRKVDPTGADIVKRPSASVCVVTVDPIRDTVTPGNGPFASDTVPRTVF